MANHSWSGFDFSEATRVVKNDIDFNEVRFTYPGVDGVEVIDMGGQTRTIEIEGLRYEGNLSTLTQFFDDIDSERKTVADLSIYDGATLYPNCKCRVYRGRVFPYQGGYKQEYRLVFTQINAL